MLFPPIIVWIYYVCMILNWNGGQILKISMCAFFNISKFLISSMLSILQSFSLSLQSLFPAPSFIACSSSFMPLYGPNVSASPYLCKHSPNPAPILWYFTIIHHSITPQSSKFHNVPVLPAVLSISATTSVRHLFAGPTGPTHRTDDTLLKPFLLQSNSLFDILSVCALQTSIRLSSFWPQPSHHHPAPEYLSRRCVRIIDIPGRAHLRSASAGQLVVPSTNITSKKRITK